MTSWGVVIVNFNSARFAIEAAQSALADNPDGVVVIVDNASTDESWNYFEEIRNEGVKGTDYLAPLSAADIELVEQDQELLYRPPLIIIKARKNLGFAAGCNIGLTHLLRFAACDHYLLLNPDALVGAGAHNAFESVLKDKTVGLCGATVLLAGDPKKRAQAFGGARMKPITLMGENCGAGMALVDRPSREEVEAVLSYPLGAAIAFRADYVHSIGLLDERYFLYYEEADWAFSGSKLYRCAWAPDAIIAHRYGGSSGSEYRFGAQPSNRSPLSDYHMVRSRLLFALKWRPWLAPIVVLLSGAQVFRRLARGRVMSAIAVARGAIPGAARAYLT